MCVLALITVFILFLPAYYILYSIFYMELQFVVLINFIKHISEVLKNNVAINMPDTTYQENVKKNLVFIIKRHQEILMYKIM